MSRVLPILFNTDMVRAIMDGRKTVTRRLIKKSQCILLDKKEPSELEKEGLYTPWDGMTDTEYMASTYKPPYQPGDILHVRETWGWEPCWDCGLDTEAHDCCPPTRTFNHNKREWGCYVYRAAVDDDVYPSVDTWHPSIHMPKEAARTWLKVTDVRAERLQDITEEQAAAEGAVKCYSVIDPLERKTILYAAEDGGGYYTAGFQSIWDSTVKDKAKYGWDTNPWVWAIEFEQCEKPNPCILKGGEPVEDKIPCIGYGISEDDDEPCEICKSGGSWSGYEEKWGNERNFI